MYEVVHMEHMAYGAVPGNDFVNCNITTFFHTCLHTHIHTHKLLINFYIRADNIFLNNIAR